MTAYAMIDSLIDRWAEQHGFAWEREYKGFDVRSFSWPLEGLESIQIWLYPPTNGEAVVNVAHNSSVDARRRVSKATYKVENLGAGLDEALATATQWRTEALA